MRSTTTRLAANHHVGTFDAGIRSGPAANAHFQTLFGLGRAMVSDRCGDHV